MFNIVDYTHLIIKEYLKQHCNDYIKVLDATCGNGADTLFIASNLVNGSIDAYDIQENAINNTKELCKQYSNITYYLKSHDTIDETLYDLAIFNLGYLPKGNKEITTTITTTKLAIEKLILSIYNNDKLLIVIAVYIGHKEGLEESVYLDSYLSNIDKRNILITKYQNYNQTNAPYVYTISKKHQKTSK